MTNVGAEMVEFAIVVVLLIALLYGIISYGLILAAQATITQAAADAARAGIVALVDRGRRRSEAQAGTDVGLDGQGDVRHLGHHDHLRRHGGPCPSNANNTCLTVAVTYNYSSSRSSPSCRGWASSRRRPSRRPTFCRSRPRARR